MVEVLKGAITEGKGPKINQSVENRWKKCHRFWLRLLHAVMLISNVSNISFEENKPDGAD